MGGGGGGARRSAPRLTVLVLPDDGSSAIGRSPLLRAKKFVGGCADDLLRVSYGFNDAVLFDRFVRGDLVLFTPPAKGLHVMGDVHGEKGLLGALLTIFRVAFLGTLSRAFNVRPRWVFAGVWTRGVGAFPFLFLPWLAARPRALVDYPPFLGCWKFPIYPK